MSQSRDKLLPKIFYGLATALLVWAMIGSMEAADLTGQATVVDGDTLEIHGSRIRLWGIDAPEPDQLLRGADSLPYRCGAEAANRLDEFIARRPVRCTPRGADQFGRTVASCAVSETDLAGWLVAQGLALDWPH